MNFNFFIFPVLKRFPREEDWRFPPSIIMNHIFFRNKGKVRKRELYKACRMLGVPEENIMVLRYTRLRDDPRVRWREELVSDIVQQHVVSHDIDVVITFDRGGVSGHKNHSSINNALALLHLEKR